jgi:hypothetical protein
MTGILEVYSLYTLGNYCWYLEFQLPRTTLLTNGPTPQRQASKANGICLARII